MNLKKLTECLFQERLKCHEIQIVGIRTHYIMLIYHNFNASSKNHKECQQTKKKWFICKVIDKIVKTLLSTYKMKCYFLERYQNIDLLTRASSIRPVVLLSFIMIKISVTGAARRRLTSFVDIAILAGVG